MSAPSPGSPGEQPGGPRDGPRGDDRPATSGDLALERELQWALARRLVAQGPSSELTHVVLSGVAGFLAWGWVTHDQVLLWVIAIATSALARSSLRTWATSRASEPAAYFRAVRVGVAALGLAWGVGALLIGRALPLEALAWLTVVFAGLISGATLSLLSDPVSFYLLLGFLLSGLSAGTLLNGFSASHGLGVLLIGLYGATMAVFYRRSHPALVEQLSTASRLALTERSALKERAMLDALLSGAPSAIAILSEDGTVLRVNRSFERTFGYQTEMALGRNIDELVVPSREVAGARKLEEEVGGGRTVVTEAWRRRADGTHIFTRIAAAPVRAEGSLVTFVLYDDVSAMRAAREASERQVRIIEATTDLVAMADGDGGLRYLNRAGRKMLGYSPDEALPRLRLADLRPARLRALFERDQMPIVMGRGNWAGESALLHRNGREIPVSLVSLVHRSEDGTVEGYSEIARDASAQMAAREALSAARDAAEQANAAKSALLANTSHEFRTPLTGILGMAELLLDSELSPSQRSSTELIESSAEGLLRLVNDLLDLSRLEAAQLDLESAPFDLHDVVQSAARLLRPRASEQGLELITEVGPDVLRWVRGDAGRLRQVLTNLVSNAVKFTPAGLVSVAVRCEAPGSGVATVHFSVRDTGVGIAAGDLRRIFEPFRQADASATRRYGGTGLGLSIASGLVEAMKGRLDVMSEPGVGSEFSFAVTFPLADVPAQPASGALRLDGAQVLVVDDHPPRRRVTTGVLSAAGAEVREAASASEALEMLLVAARGERPFGLVVSDVVLLGGGGFELAHEVRARGELAATDILLLSSAPEARDARRCQELRVPFCLARPVAPDELLDVAVRTLGSQPEKGGEAGSRARRPMGRTTRSLKVLLAEDQPVNQRVVRAMLGRRGHLVDVVESGAEAVEAVQRGGPYDVVLMDLQMPRMGGLEATRRIRELGVASLPILALTANVSAGEASRCLAAGMDGYLSKPFRAHDLFRAVEAWGSARHPEAARSRPDHEPPEAPGPSVPSGAAREARPPGPVDVTALRDALGGSEAEEVVREVLTLFVSDGRSRLDGLAAAAEAADAAAWQRIAHAMNSGASGIRADRMAEILRRAEAAGDAEDLPALLEELEGEFRGIARFVEAFLGGGEAA